MARLFVLIFLALTATVSAAERPNIVLIMADDMGYSDIGCYGGEIRTPNLDGLAANGLRFTQFYNGARCCPTRASMLTGLYAHQAGIGGMEPDWGLPGYRGNLNETCVTMAEALGAAGYRTYMTGKWHLTNKRKAETDADRFCWPLQRGFDRFYGTIAGAGSFYTPATLTRDNDDITATVRNQPEFFYTDAISNETARFIRDHARDHADKPFFQYVAYTAPHWPLHARKKTVDKYRGKYLTGWDAVRDERYTRMRYAGLVKWEWDLSPRPSWIPDWKQLPKMPLPKVFADTPGMSPERTHEMMDLKMALYAAMIDEMDQGIGAIIAALKEAKQLDNTLILFLADNGGCAEYGLAGFGKGPKNALETIGGPGSFASYGGAWANASNTPFRYFKHDTYEGGIATPMIAHWPMSITTAGVRHDVGHIIDLMPTFLAAAGAAYPKTFKDKAILPMEGVNLLPVFDGRSVKRPAPLFWEHHGNRAVRDGVWKLVARGEEGPWELYNIDADRTETKNLAGAHPERVKRMNDAWWAWAKRAHVLPMNPNKKKTKKPAAN